MPSDLDPIDRAHLRDPVDTTHRIARVPGPPELRPWLRRYWVPVWDVPAGQVATQEVLQYPVCLAVVSPAYARFYGPNPGLSRTRLEGRSWAFGVMFAPAAGAHLAPGAVRDLAGTHVALDEVPLLHSLAERIRGRLGEDPGDQAALAACRAAVEERLHRLPAPDAEDHRVNCLVEIVEEDADLLTVAGLAERTGIAERTLQRLTARRLGLSPAWLIRRRRLHEAAAGLRGEESLADLALRLGYADQAHFARDLRRSTGHTPGELARRWRTATS